MTHWQFVTLIIIIAGCSMLLIAFALKWTFKKIDEQLDKHFQDEDEDNMAV